MPLYICAPTQDACKLTTLHSLLLQSTSLPAAVNYQCGPCDKRGLIAGEVERGLGDIFGTSKPLQWWSLGRFSQKGFVGFAQLHCLVPQHGRVGIAGTDAVDPNMVRTVVDCHGFR